MTKKKKTPNCSKCSVKKRTKHSSYCRECANEHQRIRYTKEDSAYRKYFRQYYLNHKEHYAKKAVEWAKANPNYQREYYARKKAEKVRKAMEAGV